MVDYSNTKITQHVLKINMDAAKLFKSGEQCFTKMSAIKVAFDQRHFAPSPIVLFPEMHSYCQLTRALLWRLITSQCCYGERVCVTDTDCMTLLLWWACLCHRYWLHDTVAMVNVSVSQIWHCCYGEHVCVTDTDCMTPLLWWACLCHGQWLLLTVAMVSVSMSLILTAWHCCYGERVCFTGIQEKDRPASGCRRRKTDAAAGE